MIRRRLPTATAGRGQRARVFVLRERPDLYRQSSGDRAVVGEAMPRLLELIKPAFCHADFVRFNSWQSKQFLPILFLTAVRSPI
jgi:hypothetical protein